MTPRTLRTLLLAALVAHPAAATTPLPSCAELTALLSSADPETRPHLTGADNCFAARTLSGAQSYHCTWEFSYRDPTIPAAFDALATQFNTCLPTLEPTGTDSGVNHPDTYDQRWFRTGDTAVTLSVKDKSARAQTFIFLGIAPDS